VSTSELMKYDFHSVFSLITNFHLLHNESNRASRRVRTLKLLLLKMPWAKRMP